MRRALLSAPRVPTGPFTVGEPDASYTTYAGSALFWTTTNPAPHAGTLTTVKISLDRAASVTVCTGTGNATSFTVVAQATLSCAAGLNTIGVNLAIPTGGIIGVYGGFGVRIGMRSAAGDNVYSAAGTPTVGTTYAAASTTPNTALALNGSGS